MVKPPFGGRIGTVWAVAAKCPLRLALANPMLLDMRTLFVVLVMTFSVFGVLQLLIWALRRSERAFLLWGLANLSAALGGLLASLRDLIPDLVSITLANGAGVLGHTLLWAGLRRFDDRRVRWSAVAIAPLTIMLVFAFYDPVGQNLSARIFMFHGLIGLAYAACFYDSWQAQKNERLNLRYAAMTGFSIAIIFVITRITLTMTDPGLPSGYLDPSRVQSLSTLASVLIVLLWNLSVMLMANERLALRLTNVAHSDALTGVLNRAGFQPLAQRCVERYAINGQPVSLLLMDLDHFKKINDVHGHGSGDELLRAFVDVAQHASRPGDLLARYGGEEFCALLPGASLAEAMKIAERIRKRFETTQVRWGERPPAKTTVSIGVVEIALPEESIEAAIGRADRALYAAKYDGCNRVVAGFVQADHIDAPASAPLLP